MDKLTDEEIDEIIEALDYRDNHAVFRFDITENDVKEYKAKIDRIRDKLNRIRPSS